MLDLSSLYNSPYPSDPVLEPWSYVEEEEGSDFDLLSNLALIAPQRAANNLLAQLTAPDILALEADYAKAARIAARQRHAWQPDIRPSHLDDLATYIDRRSQSLTSAPLMAGLLVSSIGDIRAAQERGDAVEAQRLKDELATRQQLLVGLDILAGLDESAAALHAIPARARLHGFQGGLQGLQDVGRAAVRRPLLGAAAVGLTGLLTQAL